jgi:hypothetical protein
MKNFAATLQSDYWNNMAKFIFISTHMARNQLIQVSTFFNSLGVLDSITVGSFGEKLVMYSFNPFENQKSKRFYEISDKSNLYPDKLKYLKGYAYKMVANNEFPVGVHQNGKIVQKFIAQEKTHNKVLRMLNNREIDLSLNTAVSFKSKPANAIKAINTFQTDGYCTMLPYPERKSFFSYVMKPYDTWSLTMIAVSMICLVIVWHLLNKYTPVPNPNSPWYFLFAFIAFFIGQGAEFREHRLLQKILIQLMIMMTFMLGNAYQSVLISLMAESRYGEQITTIQGMVDSNFTFKTDPVFMNMFKESEQYQGLHSKITGIFTLKDFLKLHELSSEKTGLILECSVVDALYMNTANLFEADRNAIDFFYKLSHKLYSFYEMFPTAPYSMFANRLQEYSLKIHESGIKQHWQTLLSFEDMEAVKQRESNAKEEYLLNLEDMAGAFYCLGIGYFAALIAFLFEVFNHDFIQQLNWNTVARAIRRRIRRWAWRNRVAPHRIIQVQPGVGQQFDV